MLQAIDALKLKQPDPRQLGGKASGSLVSNVAAWVSNLVGAPKKIEPPQPDETTVQAAMIDGFLGGVTIAPVRNTQLVEVQYRSPDPVFAARAANAIAEQYIDYNKQSRSLATNEATDYLAQQLEEQRKKVDDSEKNLQDYKESQGSVALDPSQNIVVQKLSEMTAEATRAKFDRIAKEAKYNQLMSLKQRSDRSALESDPAIMGNDFIQKLKSQLLDQRRTKTELGARYGESMPQMVDINNAIQATEAKLQIEIDKVVDSVKNDFLTSQSKEHQLTQALETQKRETLTLNRTGIGYAQLQREAASNRQLYDNLLQRAKETGVSGAFKGSSIRIMDHADIPRTPVLPNTSRDLMVAAVTGCLMALGLAFGFEYMDSRIKTPDELKDHLGLSFLGIVPAVPGKAEDETVLLNGEGIPPSFSEAMRAIRTSVIFSSADEGARSVVITSTAPHEGKTLVSSNLALSLAQSNQRTLLIDADMRRPRMHGVFDRPQEPGLSNVLVGTTELHDAIVPTAFPHLFFLSSGHIPPNPAELLGSLKYSEVLADLRNQFDWIVIDAPPVLAVTDAAVVAHNATGVVFVVGVDMTPRRNALAAVDQLLAAKAHFIGGVLNRVDVQRHSYYYAPYYRKDYARVYERSV
jgi:capsular exopolysaccharide synthesis family protein